MAKELAQNCTEKLANCYKEMAIMLLSKLAERNYSKRFDWEKLAEKII